MLDCRTPDDVAPLIDIDGPEFTNAIDVVFDVALSGESDYAFAACVIDGGPLVDSDGDVDGEFPECGEQFTAAAPRRGCPFSRGDRIRRSPACRSTSAQPAQPMLSRPSDRSTGFSQRP